MGGVASFLTRRQGYGRMSLADWLSYSYLLLGLLVIFIPVAWLALNSVKTPFQIENRTSRLSRAISSGWAGPPSTGRKGARSLS